MTVLQAFQNVAGVKVGPFPAKFNQICDQLTVLLLEYRHEPNMGTKGAMVDLAEKGLYIYNALPKADPEYMI